MDHQWLLIQVPMVWAQPHQDLGRSRTAILRLKKTNNRGRIQVRPKRSAVFPAFCNRKDDLRLTVGFWRIARGNSESRRLLGLGLRAVRSEEEGKSPGPWWCRIIPFHGSLRPSSLLLLNGGFGPHHHNACSVQEIVLLRLSANLVHSRIWRLQSALSIGGLRRHAAGSA